MHWEVWRDRLWAARPMTVVEDTADRVLLWIPEGTIRKIPVTPSTRPDPPDIHSRTIESLARCDWELGNDGWDVSTLCIVRPGEWHAVWVSWLADGSHLGWYINLQRPMRRSAHGFEAMDLMLDIVAEPDLSWRWKDREEFEEILRSGLFDADLGRRVWAEAEAMIDRLEREDHPFDEPWPQWQPDPSWAVPRLPSQWQAVGI